MGDIAPKLAELTDNVLVRRRLGSPGAFPARPQPGDRQRADCNEPPRPASIPHRTRAPKRRQGRGDRRGHHASGVLRGLAECDHRGRSRQRSLQEVKPQSRHSHRDGLMITRRRILAATGGLAALAAETTSAAAQGTQTGLSITRSGSQPSRKGPAENFTGVVRVDSPFRGSRPGAGWRRHRHLRARGTHRVAHPSARPDAHRHGRSWVGAKRERPERRNPARRRRLDSAWQQALARRDSDARHDAYRHFRGARWEDGGLDGAGLRGAISEMTFAPQRSRPP